MTEWSKHSRPCAGAAAWVGPGCFSRCLRRCCSTAKMTFTANRAYFLHWKPSSAICAARVKSASSGHLEIYQRLLVKEGSHESTANAALGRGRVDPAPGGTWPNRIDRTT